MPWYVKKTDETIYGPVELSTLRHWAADGRILSDDFISDDQHAWKSAPEISELAMDWLVDIDGKTWGPLHVLAFRDFIADGALTLDASITHKLNRETKKLVDVLMPSLLAQNRSLQSTLDSVVAEMETLKTELAEYHKLSASTDANNPEAHVEFRRELRDALQRKDAFEKEAIKWKNLCETDRQNHAQLEAELRERIRVMRETELAAQSRIEKLEQRIKQFEIKQHLITKTAEPLASPTGGGAVAGDAAALVHSYNDLCRNYEKLSELLAAKSAEVNQAVQGRAQIEKDAQERVTRMEDLMRREQVAADEARRRLAEIEEAHLELVRSYRDLNDRYIVLRQHQQIPAPPKVVMSSSTNAAAPQKDNSKQRIRLV